MDEKDFELKKAAYERLRSNIAFCEAKSGDLQAQAAVFALYSAETLRPALMVLEKELREEWEAREKEKLVKGVAEVSGNAKEQNKG